MEAGLKEVDLDKTKITDATLSGLTSWVVWQYPILREPYLCAAICPLESKGRWYPALVNTSDQSVKIFGYLSSIFTSPESAVEWLSSQPNL